MTHVTTAPIGGIYRYKSGGLKGGPYTYDACKWMTQSWLNVYFPNFEFPWQVKEF